MIVRTPVVNVTKAIRALNNEVCITSIYQSINHQTIEPFSHIPR